ncbi:pyridoxamine 5'-phosphate oxidase family protein [Desulfovibrio sp. JC022]|uniref:pyridoxamine 5'-phosphate oxidase family protein n=1 Tax=Desulfovibrio sp. JC022 TaxID=2593642 RepID=UPI0013D567EA|nr:pyridoxamine 5'-phosphate oxidase family protein [Desulfovibrio sp. JC022]NDV21862.1 pyridoxamine 5'-phosphate oxidase family protein [Desulfovibrio sp. JC022]
MQSDILWNEVEELFGKVQHVSIATIDTDGFPRISPIGSVAFIEEGRGYYFERFPQAMRENLDRNSSMSIMAVHPSPMFWVKSLWKGRFASQPALRLVCKAGNRRNATQDEIDGWLAKVSSFRFFKGHDLLWKDMSMVREFEVLRVEPVELGRMNP